MAFSVFGILSVVLEAIRPLVPFLLTWLFIDILVLAVTLRRGQFANFRARRLSLRVSLIVMAVAFVAGPWFTQANFADLIGPVDWIFLVFSALAVGIASFVLTLPIASLLR